MPIIRHDDISDDVILMIAEKAADKALEKVYAEVGKSILKKAAWIVGAVVLAIFGFLKAKGLV